MVTQLERKSGGSPGQAAYEPLTAAQILARVEELGPLIEAEAAESSRIRSLTPKLLEGLRQAGVLRMVMPTALGGPCMRVDDQVRVLEKIAYHDASTAWVSAILVDGGLFAGKMDSGIAKELFPSPDMGASCTPFPPSRADAVGDGTYKVSGNWTFASGIRNADWVMVGVFRHDKEGKQEVNAQGQPDLWWAFVPRSAVEVHDTWNPTGLQGTGSCDFTIKDVTIPERHLSRFMDRPEDIPGFDPTSRVSTFAATKLGGVPLGVARRVLDEFYRTTSRRRSTGTVLKEEPNVATGVAEAEAYLAAARGLLYGTLKDICDTVWSGKSLSNTQNALLDASVTGAGRLARQSVEIVMEEIGSRAVLSQHPFDRLFRDMSTIGRHVLFTRKFYKNAGEKFLNPGTETKWT